MWLSDLYVKKVLMTGQLDEIIKVKITNFMRAFSTKQYNWRIIFNSDVILKVNLYLKFIYFISYIL